MKDKFRVTVWRDGETTGPRAVTLSQVTRAIGAAHVALFAFCGSDGYANFSQIWKPECQSVTWQDELKRITISIERVKA